MDTDVIHKSDKKGQNGINKGLKRMQNLTYMRRGMDVGGQCEMINTSSIIAEESWPAYAADQKKSMG